jgi:hypothetical protein
VIIYIRYIYLLIFFISAGLLLKGEFTYSMILFGLALFIHMVDLVKISLKAFDEQNRDDCCCEEE